MRHFSRAGRLWHCSRVGLLKQFVEWLESGEKTEAEVLEICLERIREREPEIQAWVEVAPQPRTADGPLCGIPFGVKDIFETANLATEYGSPIYAGRRGQRDAALVGELKQRGAVVLGKTHTTAFAYFDPAPTRNPHNPEHTPGGSSSGSAAAVAAGMIPFALGTQTQGSVLRPASYCGVAGFKPTYGLLSLDGVLPFAPSLDTAGLFTQTAEDMRLLWQRMGFEAHAELAVPLGVPGDLPEVAPEMKQALRDAAARLGAEPMLLPAGLWGLDAGRVINDYEGARMHQQRWREHGERIGRKLAELVERGLRISDQMYRLALDTVAEMKHDMADVFRGFPVILTPAAPGAAPLGLDSTGDPRMNAPWTALGVPAISIPMPVSGGLPLGLQMTAAWGKAATLIEAAFRAEQRLQHRR